jgi:hypothetical protein
MRSGFAVGRWASALIGSILMLLVGPAASAFGAAELRLVHAVPGAGAAQLHAKTGKKEQQVGAAVAFGQVGGYTKVPAGRVTLRLGPGGDSLATATERLENRARYTVVALGNGAESLRILRDGTARPGGSQLRVVHAAPELGAVEVRLGDTPVAQLDGFESVAGYTAVDPGAYAIRVTRPNGGSTLAARGGVPLTAGTSSTAFVVGTAGEPLDVVVAADRSAVPRGAPQTGLGGLADDGPSLLAALLAGLLAAVGGAVAYMALTGRSRGRGT